MSPPHSPFISIFLSVLLLSYPPSSLAPDATLQSSISASPLVSHSISASPPSSLLSLSSRVSNSARKRLLSLCKIDAELRSTGAGTSTVRVQVRVRRYGKIPKRS
ncbi:uncharacterized protein LOC114276962 isoform X2 [Camellia sinensis]|uniref:uncharacterized protein LOC114276962 isoform X2 n=1 Tax=Camellia sinensis TaxID=4442 RepID=UPI001035FECD|nr:uncharacterized protein LOC114276962 isoform X2 [Camellia sinensis]